MFVSHNLNKTKFGILFCEFDIHASSLIPLNIGGILIPGTMSKSRIQNSPSDEFFEYKVMWIFLSVKFDIFLLALLSGG